MKKTILMVLAFVFLLAPAGMAKEDRNYLPPVYEALSLEAMTIYNTGRDTHTPVNVLTVYIVGGATTSACSVTPHSSSMSFTTVGGLHPGTTQVTLASYSTLLDLITFVLAIDTNTAGAEGGIVISTVSSYQGVILSEKLTVTTAQSCKGSANVKTLTVTPELQTCTFEKNIDSITVRSTGGVYPGQEHFILADTNKDTLSELVDTMVSTPTYTPGIDGTLVIAISTHAYQGNSTKGLATKAATNILGVANKVSLSNTYTLGMTYTLPADLLSPEQQFRITGVSVNATFATGTCDISVYNGTSTVTQIWKERVTTSGTQYQMHIPPGGEVTNSKNTAQRWDVVSSTWITAGWMNIAGKKE